MFHAVSKVHLNLTVVLCLLTFLHQKVPEQLVSASCFGSKHQLLLRPAVYQSISAEAVFGLNWPTLVQHLEIQSCETPPGRVIGNIKWLYGTPVVGTAVTIVEEQCSRSHWFP